MSKQKKDCNHNSTGEGHQVLSQPRSTQVWPCVLAMKPSWCQIESKKKITLCVVHPSAVRS
eukprot:3940383-Pleurochrysis_carterae.AAC.1